MHHGSTESTIFTVPPILAFLWEYSAKQILLAWPQPDSLVWGNGSVRVLKSGESVFIPAYLRGYRYRILRSTFCCWQASRSDAEALQNDGTGARLAVTRTNASIVEALQNHADESGNLNVSDTTVTSQLHPLCQSSESGHGEKTELRAC